ncbi:MAG TPA: cupin domain-containing protein [Candidatus Baltobacteraceae bacterium]|nr:cupin domain-containing protein [Candidatus Baltobacteraceae bacterium]
MRHFTKGRLEVVTVAGHTIGKGTFEPGWTWSTSVKPIAQTDLCEAEHLGCIVSGKMHVKMRDGTETDFVEGDALHLEPGHDAWVVGSEPCVMYDFVGFKEYAKP